jgi:hypothetical protein
MDGAGDDGITTSPTTIGIRPAEGGAKDRERGGTTFGLGIGDTTPRPSMDGYASRTSGQSAADPSTKPAVAGTLPPDGTESTTSPTISYSTTDDEDALHMGGRSAAPSSPSLLRPERSSMSSGSESYLPTLPRTLSTLSSLNPPSSVPTSFSIPRGRPVKAAKSPLAMGALTTRSGLSAAPLAPPDPDWDYAETEWWGWVVLAVTWLVFVTGMGSCLGVWSWAWDVGTTPYAPPELENDPTLPIVGYYPALMILTCVMAWVWVTVAWVGMKYFRHARVSGD